MPTNKGKQLMKWLRSRMEELEYRTLDEVAQAMGINRGNLYRYFTLETRPSIDMIPPMCQALDLTPDELLKALYVIKS
jgi:transcriptional regulator with XRE-family HTH domain